MFLIRSWTTACLKEAGTTSDTRKLFIMDKTLGPTISKACLISFDGTLSIGESDGFNCSTISARP